jgi:3-oxoacyl-[acyl-carrier protein] reductase
LVCGGSSGVGFGIALALAAEGAKVILAARNADALSAATARINAAHAGSCTHIVCDLSKPDSALPLAQSLLSDPGYVDIVINSAGASNPISVGGAESAWQAAYQLRVVSMRQLVEALLPSMRARRYGRIVNIGGHFEAQTTINTASVMNAARTVYSKSLSHEVGAHGITANSIALGVILSGQTERGPPPVPESAIPLGHYGLPEDVAPLVLLLCSPLGRYITGEVIAVDGGLHRFAF